MTAGGNAGVPGAKSDTHSHRIEIGVCVQLCTVTVVGVRMAGGEVRCEVRR